jgi:putative endonuclease
MAELVDASDSKPACRQAGLVLAGRKSEMVFVYAIKSLTRNYIYVGQTGNLERRLNEHNSGQNRTTKAYRPFELIFCEGFENRAEARVKEKFLKSGTGKETLRKILK